MNLANDGDTILLKNGVYLEGNILINKSITLIGEGNSILDGNNKTELLTITGTREITPEIEGEGYLVKERVYGKFVRTIRLPAPVAEKKVTAEYRDGVLVLHLVKEIAVPATKILIK